MFLNKYSVNNKKHEMSKLKIYFSFSNRTILVISLLQEIYSALKKSPSIGFSLSEIVGKTFLTAKFIIKLFSEGLIKEITKVADIDS